MSTNSKKTDSGIYIKTLYNASDIADKKQAIENAGGTIEFNSVENQGTTFYLNFSLIA